LSGQSTVRPPVTQEAAPLPAQRLSLQAALTDTPTPDATVAALDKDKLQAEVEQLHQQNSPAVGDTLRVNAGVLLSTLVLVLGGLFGVFKWLQERRDAEKNARKERRVERRKRAEERFQAAVTALGADKEGAQLGGAVLLRTFLRPGYAQFYLQIFDLVVANLRLPRTPFERDVATTPEEPVLLPPLTQTLIIVFKEAIPRAREETQRISDRDNTIPDPQSLDATGVMLDNAYLSCADLKGAWLLQASLRAADLTGARLEGAYLNQADLTGAHLDGAVFISKTVPPADLVGATLVNATLTGATLTGTDLTEATLIKARLTGAYLDLAILTRADLTGANLEQADLTRADLTEATLTDAIVTGAIFSRVKGLTAQQLEAIKAKGAIIDDGSDPSNDPSSDSA
jgi:uncharacterized protein YjbI with pentapeptide repeats